MPANYVKILGKRRGRRQAEQERLAQQQQQAASFSAPQSDLTSVSVSASASGTSPASMLPPSCPEDMLEAVFRDTPVPRSPTIGTSAVTASDKMDLL